MLHKNHISRIHANMPHVLWGKAEKPITDNAPRIRNGEVFAVFSREDYNWPDSE
jgi:hypothetical protein